MRPLAYNIDFELAVMILLLMLSGYLYRHFNGNSKIILHLGERHM